MHNTRKHNGDHLTRPAYAARVLRVPLAELVQRIEQRRLEPVVVIDGAKLYRLAELRNLRVNGAGDTTPGG